MASLRFLFYSLICQAAALVIEKCQWLFVQELLSSLQSISRLCALGRTFLSRPAPEDQGLLLGEDSVFSFLLQGCLASGSALRASQFGLLIGLGHDGCELKDTLRSWKSG